MIGSDRLANMSAARRWRSCFLRSRASARARREVDQTASSKVTCEDLVCL